jgi:inosine/xanthosine triphosphatase
MKISVGSENPVKIAGAKNAVAKLWPHAEVISVNVSPGVNEQPASDDEAIKGATNRAHLSLQKTGADIGIGLEGYTIDTKYGMFVSGWVVAIDRNGKIGIGGGGRLLLPEKVAFEVRKGKELGPVMDEFTGEHNTKQKEGAVGIYALTKFISPEYYK